MEFEFAQDLAARLLASGKYANTAVVRDGDGYAVAVKETMAVHPEPENTWSQIIR